MLIRRSLLSNLELAVRRASSHDHSLQPPSVLTDATPQKIYLNKWIMGEIGMVRRKFSRNENFQANFVIF